MCARLFVIGTYEFYVSPTHNHYKLNYRPVVESDWIVKSYDRLLHQRLSKHSWLVKILLRADFNPITKLVPEQNSVLSRHFSKYELGKLSLLWFTILGGYQNSAEMLVRYGAEVNELFGRHDPQIIDEKWTVLHVLLQMHPSSENKRLIRQVIIMGANLEAQDSKGRTVLHIAVLEGRKKMIKLLLAKGADLNATDNEGMTPLFEAVSSKKADKLMALLVKLGVDINDTDSYGMTPLLNAAMGRKAVKLLPLLVKHGADVFAKDKDGQNVLHILSWAPVEYIDAARFFIERGVSLDDRNHIKKYQPLHIAASSNAKNELAKLYLDHGADVNSRAENDWTPLYLTLLLPQDCNMVPLLQTLLERGANVNHRTTDLGRTALHEACLLVDEEKIRILLSAGADMLIYDNHEEQAQMPLDYLYRLCQDVENPSVRLMLKTLALRRVFRPSSIKLTDETISVYWPEFWNFFQDCVKKLEETKIASVRFIKTCTFFELLTKCHCQIATLMRNPEFEINFKKYDLSEFSMYAEDMNEAFERAKMYYDSVLEQEDVIAEAVYDVLPYMIVRRIADYILECDNVKHRKHILGIE